jgi:type I restriction enzyme S subunit
LNPPSEKITLAATKETNAHIVPKNAVLIAMYGATVGETAILGIDAATNQAVCHVIPDPNTAHFRFVWYALKSRLDELLSKRVGGAQPNISQGIIRGTIVPVPPLAEQERIVKLLDEADELRRLRAQADELNATLIPALFHEMFGDPEKNPKNWPHRSFEEIIASTKLGLVRGAKETDDSLPYAYVRMDAILGDGRLALEPVKRVNANAAEVADFSLADGDFLFNTRNSRELVGKTALFEGQGTFLFNNNIMRIRFINSIDPRYMIALFQTKFIKRQLEARKSGTTSVVAIYFKSLRDLKVVVPPLPLQKEFAKRVTEIRELEARQSVSRQRLDDLFQSMLHREFNGEL